MKKKLVIMLSTYNGEKYLHTQLDSISKQIVECDIVLLVRDDGSSDATSDILKSWERKLDIKYVAAGASLGAAKSFWHLMKNAPAADYYAFMDQDDAWDPNKLSAAIEVLDNISVPILWFSNYRIIDANGNIIDDLAHKKTPILTIPSELVCGIAQGCSMVFNDAAYKYVMAKNIEIAAMHDQVVMTYILAIGMVYYEKNPLFSYRVHSNNVVAKKGKSYFKQWKGSLIQWFGKGNKHTISQLAGQIIYDNQEVLSQEIYEYLNNLSNCKYKLLCRYKILRSKFTVTNKEHSLRSFKIRVFLGII